MASETHPRDRLDEVLEQDERSAITALLAQGVAHGLNNPLLTMRLLLDELQERVRPDEGDSADLIQQCIEAVERCSRTARTLLLFTGKLGDGEMPTDVGMMARRAVEAVENQAYGKVAIRVLADDGTVVHGGFDEVLGLLVQLLLNAIHTLPVENGVESGRVEIAVTEEGDWAKIEVAGPHVSGPAPHQLQGATVDSRLRNAGLSHCRRTLRRHGGRLEIVLSETESGSRTTVRAWWPLARLGQVLEMRPPAGSHFETYANAPAGAKPAAASADGGRSAAGLGRILVVDDEQAILTAIRRVLAGSYEVECVSRPSRALEMIEESPSSFDLVLCDLMMPEMTGMELYRRVAEGRTGFESKFVFMTGGTVNHDLGEFGRVIRERRIEKPFDRTSLMAFLGAWLHPRERA